jgi:RND family efflux transporter MFP subunit
MAQPGNKGLTLAKWLGFALLLILLVILAWYTLGHVLRTYPAASRRAGRPLPVEVHRTQVVDLTETVGAGSTTAPFREVNVRSEVPGILREVPLKIGEAVAPGVLVARLEDREYRAAVAQAAAALKAAAEQVQVTGLSLKRYQALYQQKFIPLAELEKYRVAHANARAAQEAAQRDLVLAKRHLDGTRVLSPVHGVMSGQQAHPGEYVEKNAALLNLGQITPILVQARVPEEKIAIVQVGQEATVTLDAFPGEEMTGRVHKIDPRTDPTTRVFSAFVELPNADQRLRLGLTGYTRLQHRRRALAIPSLAVVNLFAKPSVFVVTDGQARLRTIVPGGTASGFTWIKEGLAPGDEVVVAGQRYLKDGDPVRVGAKP